MVGRGDEAYLALMSRRRLFTRWVLIVAILVSIRMRSRIMKEVTVLAVDEGDGLDA